MIKRKIINKIEEYLQSKSDKLLVLDGTRQVGKSILIREICKKKYDNYIEVDLKNDKENAKVFSKINSVDKFYKALNLDDDNHDFVSTIIFLDEIQTYTNILILLKSLLDDKRLKFIAASFSLNLTLEKEKINPDFIEVVDLYPLDFEEFLWANNYDERYIDIIRSYYEKQERLPDHFHKNLIRNFKNYILVGGMPEAVSCFLKTNNIDEVRKIHDRIIDVFFDTIIEYENLSRKRLKLKHIYDLIPYILNSTNNRIIIKNIEGKIGVRTNDYKDEFEYLSSSKFIIDVKAIHLPSFPLKENIGKQYFRLYLNDIGLYSSIILKNNIKCNDPLDSLYKNFVAQQLNSQYHNLYYYRNIKSEINFIINDKDDNSIIPIEVNSGKQNKYHKFLSKFMNTNKDIINQSIIISDEAEYYNISNIYYMPIYFVMFFNYDS